MKKAIIHMDFNLGNGIIACKITSEITSYSATHSIDVLHILVHLFSSHMLTSGVPIVEAVRLQCELIVLTETGLITIQWNGEK